MATKTGSISTGRINRGASAVPPCGNTGDTAISISNNAAIWCANALFNAIGVTAAKLVFAAYKLGIFLD